MSVNIENLHPGDWVTGIEDLRQRGDGFFHRPYEFDGMPYKVKAISAPFIVCERNGTIVTMDTRIVGLTKLLPGYVRALRNETAVDETPEPRKKKRKPKRDSRDCPRCGQRMVQRIPNGSVKRDWHRVCPDCQYDSGPAERGIVT